MAVASVDRVRAARHRCVRVQRHRRHSPGRCLPRAEHVAGADRRRVQGKRPDSQRGYRPTAVTVTFSDNVNPADINATDLVLSGTALSPLAPAHATSLTWIDAHTVEFNLTGQFNNSGSLSVSLAANTVGSVHGTGRGRLLRQRGLERRSNHFTRQPDKPGRNGRGFHGNRNRNRDRLAGETNSFADSGASTRAGTKRPASSQEGPRRSSPEEGRQARGRRRSTGLPAEAQGGRPKHKTVAAQAQGGRAQEVKEGVIAWRKRNAPVRMAGAAITDGAI